MFQNQGYWQRSHRTKGRFQLGPVDSEAGRTLKKNMYSFPEMYVDPGQRISLSFFMSMHTHSAASGCD